MSWSSRVAGAWLAVLCLLPAGAPVVAAPDAAAARPWRVGVVREWLPIDGIDARGRHTGASADILAAAAASLGRGIEAVPFDDYDHAVAAARAGEVDLLSSVSRTPQREAALHFTQTVLRLPVAYITRRDTTDFSEANDFGGRTVAVERGYPAQGMLRERFPAVRRLEVDSTAEALRAVADGRADVYRGTLAPAHYVIEREQLANLRVLGTPRLEDADLAFAAGDAQLAEALDGALRALGPARIAEMQRRWQPAYLALAPAAPAIASAGPPPAVGELRVTYDASFAPITHTKADGGADGLAIEVFRRSAAAAGLPYRFAAKPSFAAAIQALRSGEADVVVAAVRTPERLRDGLFVGPYYSTPSAIISRLDGGWPTLSSLAGRTLAIDEEHYLIPAIVREAPAVRLNVVPTATAVLAAVAAGQADAGITNVEVAAGLVATRYVGQLQVSGFVENNPSELYFMVAPGRRELAAALDAGFARIPENERRMLANSLLRTNIHVGVDWRPVALVVVPLLVGLTVLWLSSAWSARRLRASQNALREERDRANAEARARADFVADMSHEVRTPLVALTAGLRLLDRQPTLPAAARRVLDPLLASAHRLVELLNTLLDMARLEAGRLEIVPEPADAARLITGIASAFEPLAAAKGVALHVHVDPPLPLLMLDPQRTQQVVNNLVANAVKFTEHGEVEVTLHGRALGEALWELTLSVRDTGPGMSAAVRESLFGRFVQAPGVERRNGGSGLGLAIAQQLVERADGRISVRSDPGQGSEFVVVIRTREARALPSAAAGRAAPGLLLVDDDAVNLLVFAEQLRARGFSVETAHGADAARALLAQREFDVLVTDFNMGPGASGTELVADVMQRRREGQGGRAMRIFVLSGDEAPEPLPAGVDAWLSKPRHADDRAWLQNLERSVAGELPA
ncbi:transporter substrate-binding domain-containing protein [Piscinibacter sp.]|uniref:transporter substrate-binding domain-containing protein n=1 Tax=Piscinibacter sp. TaxID=1903157 RepID=UPI0039E2316A